MNEAGTILTLNVGSSGIKFSLFDMEKGATPIYYGHIEKNDADLFQIIVHDSDSVHPQKIACAGKEMNDVVNGLTGYFEQQAGMNQMKAIGHRLIYGMEHTEPQMLNAALLAELKNFSVYDPEHLPAQIALIEAFGQKFPLLPQVGCFDTAFHASMPRRAKMLPIPRRYYDAGIRRYGFHGISYSFLLNELERVAGATVAGGKIVFAHLGNGASLAAVSGGKSIDTSMGFTPTSGLMMGTRCGDLDPGIVCYLMEQEKFTAQTLNHLINYESGLLGISATSSDMQELLLKESGDSRAAEAIELFCYQVKKWIGSMAAALGGLDTLVFSGGIGERSATIRSRICEHLSFLGIHIDADRNEKQQPIISTDTSPACVRVIPTNEELMIAQSVQEILHSFHKTEIA